ncbi:hypothetical protein C8R47DRAFT_527387 [Mycena vitilis]|nr:hypothetical protein C8R47DRAFT_527387 [Mycena vitilis]
MNCWSEHADWWLNQVKPLSNGLLKQLEAARDEKTLKIVDGCPVRSIREVKEDGTEILLGDIGIDLAEQPWELEGTGKLSQKTPRRDSSDPEIWTLGGGFRSLRLGRLNSLRIRLLGPEPPRPGYYVGRCCCSGRGWEFSAWWSQRLKETREAFGCLKKKLFKFRKTMKDAIDVHGRKRGAHTACAGMELSLEDEAKVDV